MRLHTVISKIILVIANSVIVYGVLRQSACEAFRFDFRQVTTGTSLVQMEGSSHSIDSNGFVVLENERSIDSNGFAVRSSFSRISSHLCDSTAGLSESDSAGLSCDNAVSPHSAEKRMAERMQDWHSE